MRNKKYLMNLIVLLLCAQVNFAQTEKNNSAINIQQPTIADAKTSAEPATELHLGRYDLYIGIPAMNIGHFVLMPNGKYKVAFSNNEDDYDETGTYKFHADTQTIEWTGGMFKNNNWSGKLTQKENTFRIDFNASAYGISK